MRATKIKMMRNCLYSNNLMEIDEIYITGCSNEGFFKKEKIYDYLIEKPNSIQVNVYPFPNLEPALSKNNEKFVRSESNSMLSDNLLSLPRE